MNIHPATSDRRNLRRPVIVGAVLVSGVIGVTLGISGAASADNPPITLPPGVTIAPTNPPVVTLPPGVTVAPTNPPVITIPGGLPDDPPLTIPGGLPDNPPLTIPGGLPDNPPLTIPGGLPTTIPVTLPPGVTLVPTSTPTDDPGDAGGPADEADPAGNAAGNAAGNTAGATATGTPAEAVEPFLEITSAVIDCEGLVHVEYETGASPEPSPTTEHLVMVSPVDDPSTVASQRLTERFTNGEFVLDIQATAAPQSIVITADFEPANAEGVILVDEANAVPADDCQVTSG